MEVDLYLPYYDYNDGMFDVSNDYYNGDEYAKAMSSEYNKNKDVVFNSMLEYGENSRLVQGGDGNTYAFNARPRENEDKVSYALCKAIAYDENGNKETVDGLISRYVSQKPFIEMFEFDENGGEEEFMSELSLWVREHKSINEYREYKGEEWTWVNEPKRNVKIHFLNKKGEDVYAILANCKIMDIVDDRTMIVFVEDMRLLNE